MDSGRATPRQDEGAGRGLGLALRWLAGTLVRRRSQPASQAEAVRNALAVAERLREQLKGGRREFKLLKGRNTELERELDVLERITGRLLAECGALPLPPPELRDHVGRGPHAGNFLAQGLDSSARVLEVFGSEPSGPVLDWGCGSGRTLTWLRRRPAWRQLYHGCDVDAGAIAWLRGQGIERLETCGDLPPLPYPDASFEGLFSFSVLTHIPPADHAAWYSEIHRVLRPGGRAYMTVHGDHSIQGAKGVTDSDRETYRRQGWFWSEREGHYKHAAVVSRGFTLAVIGGLFEIEDYRQAGYHTMDAFVLRKRKG